MATRWKVALVAFGDPNQPFGAIDVVRKLLEKVLKFLHGKGPRALKRNGLETVRRQMIAIGGMPAAGVELIAFVICVQRFGRSGRRSGNGEKKIRLEQSDAEDKRKRDPALGCAHHPRLRLDLPDRGLNPSQLAGANEIALVEQNDVAVTKLIARSLALEAVEAEVGGIGNGDDRVDAHVVPQFRAQKRENHRQWIGDAACFDDQVIESAVAVEQAKDRVQEIVVYRTADAAVFQLEHVGVGGGDQIAVDAELAQLVDDDPDAQALLVGKDMLDQRGLAAAEEAGDHGDRQTRFGRGMRRGFTHAIRSARLNEAASMAACYNDR